MSSPQVVLYGMPMDATVSYRPGARFGPQGLRAAIDALEAYSPYRKRSLTPETFIDAGDLLLPWGNVTESLAKIRRFVAEQLEQGRWPFGIGGEHLVTLPIVEALHTVHPGLVVLQFDAHADLADQYYDQSLSHATVMRRVAECIGPTNLYQLGIRSWTEEEEAYAQGAGIQRCPWLGGAAPYDPGALLDALPLEAPLYVTLDIDILDPAYAPGTGTPEPGGLTTNQLLDLLYRLGDRGHTIVGADIVEVAPELDPSGQTAVLAAKLFREMVLTFPSKGL